MAVREKRLLQREGGRWRNKAFRYNIHTYCRFMVLTLPCLYGVHCPFTSLFASVELLSVICGWAPGTGHCEELVNCSPHLFCSVGGCLCTVLPHLVWLLGMHYEHRGWGQEGHVPPSLLCSSPVPTIAVACLCEGC